MPKKEFEAEKLQIHFELEIFVKSLILLIARGNWECEFEGIKVKLIFLLIYNLIRYSKIVG